MDYEVLEALGQITREKNVDMDLVLETLEAGLKSAAKKKFGTSDHIRVTIDRNTGEIGIFATRKVVEEVEEKALEMTLEEAQQIEPDAQIDQEIEEQLEFSDFGRNAIQAAKQILIQRIREAERDKIFEDYSDRTGEIITGSVQQVDRGNLIVNLGRPEGIVPIKEQIRRERYRQGDTIRAYLLDVQKTTKGPQIILSRTHPAFLEKLFELEVPEIYEKIVEIKAIAREAGDRSKVAVASNDARVDPVGACVGLKGIRVQNIVRELSNERIDIVPWSADPATFVNKAISPAKVSRIEVDDLEHKMTIVVEEDQLSLAIGRAGQNVRLAAKLTGWKIDILSDEEYKRRAQELAALRVDIADLKGVGSKLAGEMRKVGVDSVQGLAKMNKDQLTAVPGVGPATAEKLLAAASDLMAEIEAQRLETAKAEAEQQRLRDAEEAARLTLRELADGVDISKMRGVGPKLTQELHKAGVSSLYDLYQMDAEQLLQVPSVGPATAERLLETAREGMKQVEEALKDQATQEAEDLPEPEEDQEPEKKQASEAGTREEPEAERADDDTAPEPVSANESSEEESSEELEEEEAEEKKAETAALEEEPSDELDSEEESREEAADELKDEGKE